MVKGKHFSFFFLSQSVFESPWKRSQSTAARELYDGTQETDNQLQRTDAIGRNLSHGKTT